MHRSGLGGLIIDCQTDDLDREARFWSQAPGVEWSEGETPTLISRRAPDA